MHLTNAYYSIILYEDNYIQGFMLASTVSHSVKCMVMVAFVIDIRVHRRVVSKLIFGS